jgi:Ferredoxin-like domain in Api92-like protein
MPNHVTQQLIIVGAAASKVLKHIAGNESALDFNKIIPMPIELDIEESSDGHMGLAAITGNCSKYLTFPWVKENCIRTPAEFTAYVERVRPQAIELARKYLSNKQKFGHMTWREWCYANWGTKWNAYSVNEPKVLHEQATIRFDTAWSPAIPVIARLSQQFLSASFTLRYFDEGWGFAGEAIFGTRGQSDECFAPDANDERTRSVYFQVYEEELKQYDEA